MVMNQSPKSSSESDLGILDKEQKLYFQKIEAAEVCISEVPSQESARNLSMSPEFSLRPKYVNTPFLRPAVITGTEIESPMFNIQLRDFNGGEGKKKNTSKAKFVLVSFLLIFLRGEKRVCPSQTVS